MQTIGVLNMIKEINLSNDSMNETIKANGWNK